MPRYRTRIIGAAAMLALWTLTLPHPAIGQAAAQDAEQAVIAREVSLEDARTRATMTVRLDRPVETRVFTLANPYRVIVDLPNVAFARSEPEEGGALVSAYRFGMIAPGRGRIVIDTSGPVTVDVRSKPGENRTGAELVIALKPSSREAFLRQMAVQEPQQASAPVREAPRSPGDERPLIVLDPGHGGVDPGARGRSGEQEKDIVLRFANSLRDKLQATGRYRVLLTRDDDSFISLGDRVRFARRNEAALFISIHADALSSSSGVRGATVYTLGDRPTDAEAARLAEKENRADALAGVEDLEDADEVAGILMDLAQRETKVFTARFSQVLVDRIRNSIRLNKNPQRSAGFRVLRAPDIPSVLLELGYMSSSEDLKLLTSEAWRGKAGNAMVTAIDRFFGEDVAKRTAQGGN